MESGRIRTKPPTWFWVVSALGLTWNAAGLAVAVFGGVIGCLALLLRKSWALTMLLISLAGIVLRKLTIGP